MERRSFLRKVLNNLGGLVAANNVVYYVGTLHSSLQGNVYASAAKWQINSPNYTPCAPAPIPLCPTMPGGGVGPCIMVMPNCKTPGDPCNIKQCR